MASQWDQDKAEATRRKHGISFSEAETVTRDPLTIVIEDRRHSELETRFSYTGMSSRGRVLVVTVTFRGDSIRVISARRASKRERHAYSQR